MSAAAVPPSPPRGCGRAIAFAVLRRVEEGGAYASRALDAALASAGALDPREAGLATELVYGTLRRALALDAALARHARRPLAEVDPAARVALRLGAYELFHMRTPAHAAVSEAVALARSVNHGRAAGFVNAVLRALASRGNAPPAPSGDPVGDLALSEALPRWLAEEWVAWFGAEEARALAAAMNTPAPLTLRAAGDRAELLSRLGRAGLAAQPTLRAPAGVRVSGAPVGAVARAASPLPFSVQDEAAQLVSLFAAGSLAGSGGRVLDACAAPGGKTFHLADLLGAGGEVVAVEAHPRKAEELRRAAEARAGERRSSAAVRVVCADATRPVPGLAAASFDAVLVDAPCTGLGTLRRHPELKLRRTASDPARMAETQRALLESCAALVRPGGSVTYSVCSLTRAEGPEVVAAVLAGRWSPELSRARLVSSMSPDLFTPEGDLLTLPSRHGCDGFYAARLSRCSAPTMAG